MTKTMPMTQMTRPPEMTLLLGFPVLTAEGQMLPIWLERRERRAEESRFSCRVVDDDFGGVALQDDVFSGGDGGLNEARWQALDLARQHLVFVFESEEDRRSVLRGPARAGWLAIGGYSASLAIDLACSAATVPAAADAAAGLLVSVQRSVGNQLQGLGRDALAKATAVRSGAGQRRLALLLLSTDLQPGLADAVPAGPDLPTWLATARDNLVITVQPGDAVTRAHELLGWLGGLPPEPVTQVDEDSAPAVLGPTFSDLWRAALPNQAALRESIERHARPPGDTALFEIQARAVALRERVFAGHVHGTAPDNLLIAGPTGCGKTVLGAALCLNAILERRGVVLYLAPTRALAYEFHRRFVQNYGGLLNIPEPMQRLVVSTGERGESDLAIRLGHVDLACIVTEKANVLMELKNSSLLGRLALVLVDELHMLTDPARGGVVDLMLTKLLAEQRRREADLPLQIVGLSTESLNAPIAAWWSQAWQRPPLTLGGHQRPEGVRHQVLVHGLKAAPGAPDWIEHDLLNFEDDHQRRLQPRSREVADLVTSLGNRLARQQAAKTPDNRCFADTIERQWTRGCRTVLFAYGSKEVLRRIARQLKNRRSRSEEAPEAPAAPLAALKSILRQTDETSATIDERCKWAEHGVFVHDGDTPASVRSWIEQTFSVRRPAEWADWPVVILCTETLTYGVNLSADVVVLGGLEFPRESGAMQPLDANQFHNLLGRVGRPGMSGDGGPEPRAIVCFRADAALGLSHWQDFVHRYYTAGGLPEQTVSALFTPRELADCRLRRQQRDHPRLRQLAVPPRLEQVRAATFRAVVDVVHHLGGVDTEVAFDEIVRFVALTIHHGTCSQDDADAVPWLIDEVLQAAVQFSGDGQPHSVPALVERAGPDTKGRYRLRAAAKALIDTGTQISAIKPIAGWLSGLKAIAPASPVAPELMVPGLVLTPEFWNAARPACSEGAETRELAHAYENASLSRALDLLKREFDVLERPGMAWDALVARLQEHLRDHGQGLEHASNEAFKLSILMKLTAMAWAWLRGAPVDEIVAMYDKVASENERDQRPSSFHARLAERLSWLAQMTHRFFGEASDWLPDGFERDLPDLSRRLRLGLPPAGLPMLGVRASLDKGRQTIAGLLAQGIRPRHFLMPHDGGAVLEAAVAQQYRRRVRRSYRASLDNLRQALFEGTSAVAAPSLAQALADIQALLANDPREAAFVTLPTAGIGRDCEAALAELLARVLPSQGQQVHATTLTLVSDGRRLVWRSMSSSRPGPSPDRRLQTLTVRMHEPWPMAMTLDDPEVTHMTASGALCLAYLASRGLLSWPRVMDRVEAARGRLLQLRDIVARAHAPAMKQTGALFDALLLWDEPGVL